MNTPFVKLFALASLLAFCATAADARTLVFSNFGKHGTSVGGDCIDGPATANCAINIWLSRASPFVPTKSGTLDSIDVAVGQYSGARGVTVTLVVDKSGAPSLTDPILESWTLDDKEKPCCTSKTKDTLNSATHPALTTGAQYWVVVSPLGFDSLSIWQQSPTATNTFSSSLDGGNTWRVDGGGAGNGPPAFDVWVQ